MSVIKNIGVVKNSNFKEWVEFPGNKKYYIKSRWEHNYACYLQFLKQQKLIIDWEYEPEKFYFEGIKSGTTNYKPDFRVHIKNSLDASGFEHPVYEYVEVKGYWDAKSVTKVNRFRRYFPEKNLVIIEKDWFKEANKKWGHVIKGWIRN